MTESNPSWWQIVFLKDVSIYKIEIFPSVQNPSDMFPSFVVASSLTGEFKGEEKILVKEENWKNIPVATYEFSPITTRYLRLIPLKPQPFANLQEFRVYPAVEPTPTPTFTPTPTSPFNGHEFDDLHWFTNIGILGYATAKNYYPGREPKQAIDGDTSTIGNGWSPLNFSEYNPSWWQIVFLKDVSIYKIEIFPSVQNPSDMFPSFVVASSLTGEFKGEEKILVKEENWKNILVATYEFSPITTRYLRLIPIESRPYAVIQEFRVYPAVEPTPTPTTYFSNIHGEPTNEEQLVLEYINRARLNPVIEAKRLLNSYKYYSILGDGYHPQEFIDEFEKYFAQPPMSMNDKLLHGARLHAKDMAINRGKVFGHFGSDGSSPYDRVITIAGYEGTGCGENVADSVSSSENAHSGFIVDIRNPERGHRHAIINSNPAVSPIIEAGIAMYPIPSMSNLNETLYSCVEEFGSPNDRTPRLCGVVYDDINGNSFYDLGEGIGNVIVKNKEGWYQTKTSTSGGYTLPIIIPGKYEICFEGLNGLVSASHEVIIDCTNVKNDLMLHLTPIPTSTPIPTIPPLGPNVNIARGQIVNATVYTFDGYGCWKADGNINLVVDGNISESDLCWFSGKTDLAYLFLDIKLPNPYEIEKINIYPPARNPNDLFTSFKILASLTGDFNGEEIEIIREEEWRNKWLPIINSGREIGKYLPISYIFNPFVAQYIRLIKLTGTYFQGLQEIEIYPPATPLNITPTPITATNTPSPTFTFTPTKTSTPSFTSTPTKSLPGHECENLHWDTNIAPLGYASAEETEDVRDPTESIDYDISSRYNGWFTRQGMSWWQLKLPCELPIYKIDIFPTFVNYNDMYTVFDIASSLTGEFNGEETIIVSEKSWPAKFPVSYDFTPIRTRYLRVIPKESRPYAVIQEFRVYPAVEPTPTPTFTPTPTSPFTGHEFDNITNDTNIASLGYATAESFRKTRDPKFAIDGDKTTPENGWSPEGDMGWWQVWLPGEISINRIEIFPSVANPSDLFSAFKIETSLTGEFNGEGKILVIEDNWPSSTSKIYKFSSTPTRYLRFIPLKSHPWAILQEFRAYPDTDANPTPNQTMIKNWSAIE
ncbi:MAG: discoidin domain-containing protein [Candidatus Omnitrophota bacterium]